MDTPPPISPRAQTAAFAHHAAKASWESLVIIFVLMVLGNVTGTRALIELIALLLMILGLALGVVALFGIRKHGTKGILAPAIVGILINGLLVCIFATNYFAAKRKAERAAVGPAISKAGFQAANPESEHKGAPKVYRGEGFEFGFAGAYELMTNTATGQLLLQHNDSTVIITRLGQVADVVETLKQQASTIQEKFKDQLYAGITEHDLETIDGSVRSGRLVRLDYDKPGIGRMHADVYILSEQMNSVSILHFYSDAKKSNAVNLFQTVLLSFKDGN